MLERHGTSARPGNSPGGMLEGRTVSVVGGGACSPEEGRTARDLGRLLARGGYVVACGGLGGVMEHVCRGAKESGGLTVGILPGVDRLAANDYIDLPVVTGLGPMRNFLVVANGDIVVAVGGGFGTLSEIALARKIGRTVVAIGGFADVEGVIPAMDAEEAVRIVRERLGEPGGRLSS